MKILLIDPFYNNGVVPPNYSLGEIEKYIVDTNVEIEVIDFVHKNKMNMKRREDLLRDILFLIEKSQRKGSRRLNADKNILYWEIGRLIKQDLYSKETTLHRIDTFKYLSRELVERYGKEFEVRHLLQMELFCVYFPELEIVSDLSKKLTWTHFLKLFLIDNKLHRDDYAKACKEEGWSSSVLHGKIMKLII